MMASIATSSDQSQVIPGYARLRRTYGEDADALIMLRGRAFRLMLIPVAGQNIKMARAPHGFALPDTR